MAEDRSQDHSLYSVLLYTGQRQVHVSLSLSLSLSLLMVFCVVRSAHHPPLPRSQMFSPL